MYYLIKHSHNQKHLHMARKKKVPILTQSIKEGLKPIKVRLDARTVITLGSKKALAFWKERYPKLEIIK